MTKKELKEIVKNKSNVVSRILKSNHINLYNAINEKYDGKKFTEKLYRYLYEVDGICQKDGCNKKTTFISIKKGFRSYCSNKCSSVSTSESRGQKIKDTFQEKYGVNSPSQLKSVKDKISTHHKNGRYDYTEIEKKRKKTKLEKYGDENYNNIKKSKKTKLKKYGDENYNNRDATISSYNKEYGMNVHPNTLKNVKERLRNNELGFNSKKYQKWLEDNDIENVSQLESVKIKKNEIKKNKTYKRILSRISKYVTPLFDINDFNGVKYYDNKYQFKCNKCNTIFEDHLVSANIPRCLSCFPKYLPTSIGENELTEFIKELLPNTKIIQNDRKILNGLELDIVIPSKRIAIEYNGLYWHSELSGGKDKIYHLNKTKLCKNKDYRLIHIKDIDWNYNQFKIKRRIKHILKSTKTKIFARNCTIKKISPKQKSNFLNKYHLQSNDKSQIRLGLYHKEELVSVMTFGNLRNIMGKSTKENHYELYRYASKYNVIGGASKLLTFFVRNYNPIKIITYSKNDWGYSNFYEKIGFTFSHNSPPNYYYFKVAQDIKLYHRSNFQKHKLKDKLNAFDPELTEWENMQLNGWDRIWDCGNSVYKLII